MMEAPVLRLESPTPRLLYTRKEAAKLLSISLSSVDLLIARNFLITRKIGHKRLISHASLVAFAQKNTPRLWAGESDGKSRAGEIVEHAKAV